VREITCVVLLPFEVTSVFLEALWLSSLLLRNSITEYFWIDEAFGLMPS
jgi:hypothetical protein